MGAAGSGKSSLAGRLYHEFKQQGIANYELAPERAKLWALAGKSIDKWNQMQVFCEQFNVEREFLTNDDVGIICECPLELNAYYFGHALPEVKSHIDAILLEYNKTFPSLNIFCILPDEKFYQQKGRFGNYADSMKHQAKIWQNSILNVADIQFSWGFDPKYQDQVIKTICQEIKKYMGKNIS